MSVARVYTTKKSRKAQKPCEKCGTELPVGSGYLYYYVGFRSNYKHVRCLKAECFPKPSERESSMYASVLAAKEEFEETIQDACSKDEAEEAVHAVGEAVQELADEYQSGLDSWENGNEQLQEKVDHYTDQASELESWSSSVDDEPERCENYDHENHPEDPSDCETCSEFLDEWLEQLRDEAREAVDSVEQAY